MAGQAVYKRGDRFGSRALTQRADAVCLQHGSFPPCDHGRSGSVVTSTRPGTDELATRFAIGAVIRTPKQSQHDLTCW